MGSGGSRNVFRGKRSRPNGVNVLLATNPLSITKIAGAETIVSDHGLHALELMLRLSDTRFIDVWHGIPFKGFDAEDFRMLHRYTEVLVPSERLKNMYVNQFGFSEQKVEVTGYARTDTIVNRSAQTQRIKDELGIGPNAEKSL